MPHFAISCPPLLGHINPFCVLGRELVRRSHTVTMFSLADAEPMLQKQGIRFHALGTEEAPTGSFAPVLDALKEQGGFRGTLFAIRAAERIFRLILDHAPCALRREGVDVVLADQNEPASATVSEYLGLPFASICTSLPINREPEIPPSFVGWDYGDGALVKLRNKLGYAVGDFLTRDLQRTLNTYRKRWGLAPLGSPENSFSKAAQVAQMPREFDFPRRIASNAVDYTGPWIDHTFESRFAGSEFPHEQLDGRPILYASLGTLQSSNSRHFELIAQACTGLDLQVVISVGAKPGVDLPKLAGNHLVVHFAPQIMLLKRSALTITHAGMNTTMHALQFGTPLIAIPLAHDQPAIGARLERAGAGIVLSPRTLTAKKLRCAIDLILEKNSPWQLEAKRMQVIIARSGGVARAADVLEQKLLKPRTRTALFQE